MNSKRLKIFKCGELTIILIVGFALIGINFLSQDATNSILNITPKEIMMSLPPHEYHGITKTSDATMDSNTSLDWTIMMYWAFDCNLDQYTVQHLNDLEATFDPSQNIEVIVMADRHPGYFASDPNWTGARVYQVISDNSPIIASTLLEDKGEINMGDPQTLRDFVTWTQINYPANRTILFIAGHGRAFQGLAFDWTDNYDQLTLDEVQQALNETHIDILMPAACSMASVEVAYEWQTFTDYIIASESIGNGYNHSRLLEVINENSSLETWELARSIGQVYINYEFEYDLTCCVINCSAIETLVEGPLSDFADYLMSLVPQNIETIAELHQKLYKMRITKFTDLGDIIDTFATSLSYNTSKLEELRTAYNAVTAINFNHMYSRETTGLNIFFPEHNQSFDPLTIDEYIHPSADSLIGTCDFFNACTWNDFIAKYLQYVPISEEKPINSTDIQADNDYLVAITNETPELQPQYRGHRYRLEIDTPSVYNITLKVDYGDLALEIYEEGEYSGKLDPWGGLISDLQNPVQGKLEQIVFWLEEGNYSIEVYCISYFNACGVLSLTSMEPPVLQLNEPQDGSFPPRRVFRMPIQMIYNYFKIELASGQYRVQLNVSDRIILYYTLRDTNHQTRIETFFGYVSTTFETTIIVEPSRKEFLIEFGSYQFTGNFSFVIFPILFPTTTSPTSSTETEIISTSVPGFIFSVFFSTLILISWKHRKKRQK
ncbi:MAG: clostripain-related cysteine peptidase [Candidatus Hodarchaeota archaeon]